MFSPSLALASLTMSPTVLAGSLINSCSSSAGTSAGSLAAICRVRSLTNSLNSSVLATKSVSQLTSTSTPMRPSWTYEPIRPERASRSPRFSALVRPFWRICSRALSKSPPASVRACLASVMPTPVSSRRRLIDSIGMSAILNLHPFYRRFLFGIFGWPGFFGGGLFGLLLRFVSRFGDLFLAGFNSRLHVIEHQVDGFGGVIVGRDGISHGRRVGVG